MKLFLLIFFTSFTLLILFDECKCERTLIDDHKEYETKMLSLIHHGKTWCHQEEYLRLYNIVDTLHKNSKSKTLSVDEINKHKKEISKLFANEPLKSDANLSHFKKNFEFQLVLVNDSQNLDTALAIVKRPLLLRFMWFLVDMTTVEKVLSTVGVQTHRPGRRSKSKSENKQARPQKTIKQDSQEEKQIKEDKLNFFKQHLLETAENFNKLLMSLLNDQPNQYDVFKYLSEIRGNNKSPSGICMSECKKLKSSKKISERFLMSLQTSLLSSGSSEYEIDRIIHTVTWIYQVKKGYVKPWVIKWYFQNIALLEYLFTHHPPPEGEATPKLKHIQLDKSKPDAKLIDDYGMFKAVMVELIHQKHYDWNPDDYFVYIQLYEQLYSLSLKKNPSEEIIKQHTSIIKNLLEQEPLKSDSNFKRFELSKLDEYLQEVEKLLLHNFMWYLVDMVVLKDPSGDYYDGENDENNEENYGEVYGEDYGEEQRFVEFSLLPLEYRESIEKKLILLDEETSNIESFYRDLYCEVLYTDNAVHKAYTSYKNNVQNNAIFAGYQKCMEEDNNEKKDKHFLQNLQISIQQSGSSEHEKYRLILILDMIRHLTIGKNDIWWVFRECFTNLLFIEFLFSHRSLQYTPTLKTITLPK